MAVSWIVVAYACSRYTSAGLLCSERTQLQEIKIKPEDAPNLYQSRSRSSGKKYILKCREELGQCDWVVGYV